MPSNPRISTNLLAMVILWVETLGSQAETLCADLDNRPAKIRAARGRSPRSTLTLR